MKVPEWRHWRRSYVFIVNFEQILHIVLVFPLLNLNKWSLARYQHENVTIQQQNSRQSLGNVNNNCLSMNLKKVNKNLNT